MSPLTRWHQLRWGALNKLEDQSQGLGSLFPKSQDRWFSGLEQAVHWIPLVAISEDAADYVIKAELPQVKKEDLAIGMENGTLTITGDRKIEKTSKHAHLIERAYGSFVHGFVLPADANPSNVTAEFNGRVLKVRLAKTRRLNPRKSKKGEDKNIHAK